MGKTKDQWIEQTGGFPSDEGPAQFRGRVRMIRAIEKKIEKGFASERDIEVLSKLKDPTQWYEKKPNQTLQPTATGVTPPAAAGDRAPGGRG